MVNAVFLTQRKGTKNTYKFMKRNKHDLKGLSYEIDFENVE